MSGKPRDLPPTASVLSQPLQPEELLDKPHWITHRVRRQSVVDRFKGRRDIRSCETPSAFGKLTWASLGKKEDASNLWRDQGSVSPVQTTSLVADIGDDTVPAPYPPRFPASLDSVLISAYLTELPPIRPSRRLLITAIAPFIRHAPHLPHPASSLDSNPLSKPSIRSSSTAIFPTPYQKKNFPPTLDNMPRHADIRSRPSATPTRLPNPRPSATPTHNPVCMSWAPVHGFGHPPRLAPHPGPLPLPPPPIYFIYGSFVLS